MHHKIFFFLFLGFMLNLPAAAPAWEILPKPPAAAALAWMALDPANQSSLWAASAHEIFQASAANSGSPDWPATAGWQDLAMIQGPGKIKRLITHTSGALFVLTGDAVFLWDNHAAALEKIFTHAGAAESSVLSFAAVEAPEPAWLAGTKDGLFVSRDQGRTWFPHAALGLGKSVTLVAAADKTLFVLAENTLYRAQSLEDAQPVFKIPQNSFLQSESAETDAAGEEEDLDSETIPFAPIFLASPDQQTLWFTTPSGIAQSLDAGRHWTMLSLSGLERLPVSAFAYAQKSRLLFAAAGHRIYAFRTETQRWHALSQDFSGRLIGLAVRPGADETLVAAAENGLMFQTLIPDQIFPASETLFPPEHAQRFEKMISQEPSPRSVQKAVVRYGNLSSGKIKRWQLESRLRALLPAFSFGRDFSRANSLDLDRGGTNDPDRYISGPDDIDQGWDADVSWDLGDLIWSTSQTSIDIREKLMIDQRRDFLAEAMRIYFERRRLQSELFFQSDTEMSATLSYEKRLRLEELTSLLDALTGGWFSGEIENKTRIP